MSFDGSRFTFDSWNNFLGVVMQQGRVQLDSDWNEWLAEFARRVQAGTLDIVGPAVYPATTPNAFKIMLGLDSSGDTSVEIGPGRMYVDGLLAENHGQPAPTTQKWIPSTTPPASPSSGTLNWDGSLDELVGSASVDYYNQPYYPEAPPFPQSGGPFLVYLDVWQREVTFVEDPDLIEKAVGVDTTGRLQMVWQVKWLDAGAGASCSDPGAAWTQLLLPPGAQLTTGVVASSASGPCCLTPNTGYTGLENQLYRVEIHQPGTLATATFKWSRDNASVATAVTGISQGGSVLSVQSTGKDNVLGFAANNWVEITDDYLEFHGLPGELHQVTIVDPVGKTITVTPPVSSSFPVDSNNQTNPYRHTRLTRWDGSGTTGDTPVSSTAITLENGVTVTFGLLVGAQDFNTGDFWVFAARSVDGTVEFLNAAPPRGIHHHYAQLAVLNFARIALAPTGTVTLSDLSQPPIPILSFTANNPDQWPQFFGVLIQANGANPGNFDLEVLHTPLASEGATTSAVVETFTNLSITGGPRYAPDVINSASNFINLQPLLNPPSATLALPSDFSKSRIVTLNSGTQSLADTNSVAFFSITITPEWPPALTVSASPGSTAGTYTLDVVYSTGDFFATLESHQNLAPGNPVAVTSEFLTTLNWIPAQPSLAGLQLVTHSDCRTPWPSVSTCCECGCMVSVKPTASLQAILDQYKDLSTSTEICFAAGTYNLPAPLALGTAHSNITLKACQPGTVIIQAQAGKEDLFRDGLVVLESANNITLKGLQFLIPWMSFPSLNNFLFAGMPPSSLDTTVAGALSSLTISIGVRPVNCSSLTVENCQFTFAQPNEGSILYGVGIFAGGKCEGLQLTGNTFTGGAYFTGGFLAGFLLAPTVMFPPPRVFKPNRRMEDVSITARNVQKTAAEVAAVFDPNADIAPIATEVDPNLELVNPGNFISYSQTPPAYAASGGSVLPAMIDEAVFESNSFSGLTVSVLILAQSETVQFSDNNLSSGGAGLWLFSPLQANLLLKDSLLDLDTSSPDYFIVSGASVAMGYPLPPMPAGNTAMVSTKVTAAPAAVYTHAGEKGANLVDAQKVTWTADAAVVAGTTALEKLNATITGSQPNSAVANQDIYKTYRYGKTFIYTFTGLAPGYYTVTVKSVVALGLEVQVPEAAAPARGATWTYVICINGVQVSTTSFTREERTKIGETSAAVEDLVFANVPVTNISNGTGQIAIQFVGETTSSAVVSAVEINPQWSQSISNPGSLTGFENLYAQLAALGEQAYSTPAPLQLRVEDNQMQGLALGALLILGGDQVQNGQVSSLMMSGNQLASSIQLSPSFGPNQLFAATSDYFVVTAAIIAVSRCVVSGNLITNEYSFGRAKCGTVAAVPNRASFLLDDRPPLPAPAIAVMSNVFQGAIWVSPPPEANSWPFYNTVTP
jgi:hypothetical protein